MRNVPVFLAAVLLASTAHGASPSPPKAPTSLSLVSCRVDDLTGQPGRHGVDAAGNYDETSAAKNWRDLELHVEDGELECKVVPFDNLEDATQYSKLADAHLIPLEPNFGDHAQCARAAMMIAPEWEQKHAGWGVVAVGCPTPIMNDNGTPDDDKDDYLVGWSQPQCPDYFPGTRVRMKCRYTASAI